MDPLVTCVHGPDPPRFGQETAYTITVTNPNPSPLAAIGITFVMEQTMGAEFIDATRGGTYSGGTVSWNLPAPLAGGGSLTVSFTLRAPVGIQPIGLTVPATVTVTSSPLSKVTIRHDTHVLEWSDLEYTVDCPAIVRPNETFTYTIRLENKNGIPVTSLRLAVGLSPHVTFVSATDGTGAGWPPGPGSMINWDMLGTLRPGQSMTVTATVKVNASAPVGTGVIRFTVISLLSNESTAKGKMEAISSAAAALQPPAISCVHTPDPARYGEHVVFSLTITNPNPAAVTSISAVFGFDHGTGFTFISASHAGAFSGTAVAWSAPGPLAPGQSLTLSVTFLAPIGMNPAGMLPCHATATVTGAETTPASVDVYANVVPWEDLWCTVGCPPVVAQGSQFTYSILITNRCEITVTSLRFASGLSPHVAFVSASDSGMFFAGAGSGGTIRWEGGPWTLPPAGTKTFTATVKVNPAAPIGNNVIMFEVFALIADESVSKGPVTAFTAVEEGSSGTGLGIIRGFFLSAP